MEAPPFTFNELIIQRGTETAMAGRVMAHMGGTEVTYGEYLKSACRWAHLFLSSRRDHLHPPRIAVLMTNNLEYLYAYGGAAFSGGTLFAINTGLGGETLARVVERSGAEMIVVDQKHAPALDRAMELLPALSSLRVIARDRLEDLFKDLHRSIGPSIDEPPPVGGLDATTPWMVIYTSGTTGLPKGIINSHGKLRAIGAYTANLIGLTEHDVGYICMPLFHSNAHYLNWLPALTVGARVILREKFSASSFVDDIFKHGATYWNYVGQPVHYILETLSKKFGGDEGRIIREVRDNPRNTLRLALGTGASGKQRERFMRWLGLEHFYEMYGSTEAEIATCCRPGDPLDSVGEVTDENVEIVDEAGNACPPAVFDGKGTVTNLQEAVGEITRRGMPTGLFQGYHGDKHATERKFQGGVYHSGDLGMIRVLNGRRYLYFVGRTDDWIRKDGENFSSQNVVDLVTACPDVEMAAAYGVPHPVSDEWVMAAVKMRDGRPFDPARFYDHCESHVTQGGADRKWFPDFVRVVDDFPFTETHKIVVRALKETHYNPRGASGVYLRMRGDTTYKPLSREDFELLRQEFVANGRIGLLK